MAILTRIRPTSLPATALTSNGDPINFTNVAGATADQQVMYVAVAIEGNKTIASMTYAGTSMTFVAGVTYLTVTRIEIWRLVNPATGNNTLSIDLSASAYVAVQVVIYAAQLSSPLAPEGTEQNSTGTGAAAASATPTDVRAGGITLSAIAVDGNRASSLAPGGDETKITATANSTRVTLGVADDLAPSEGSETCNWTWTSNSSWAMAAIAVHPRTYTPLEGGVGRGIGRGIRVGVA